MNAFISLGAVMNGYKIKMGDDEGHVEEYVSQEMEGPRSHLEAVRDVLYLIAEELVGYGSRHDEARLYITIAPGDKHPDFEDSLFQ